jgi:dephospho-CoA kinase
MIIGITGTIGAGKGTVVDYLVEQKGFVHHSAREFILEELRARGLPEDRTAMRDLANALRKEHGPNYIGTVLRARAKEHGKDAIIESIRTVAEAEAMKEEGAYLVAVDADRALRYERAIARGSSTDKLTFEQFCAEEDREMASTEPWDMNIFAVMKMADATLQNNGTREELHANIDVALAKLAA